MGKPVEAFFSDRQVFADIVTRYYTDYEPGSTFVAEAGGKVAGYLTGCKDSSKKEKIFRRSILPKVFFDFSIKMLIFRPKTIKLLLSFLKSYLKGEFRRFKLPDEYPAHLHINVDEDHRKRGVGEKLMGAFLEYLRKEKIKGVYLSTFSEHGSNFFLKNGFTPIYENTTSLWRYIENRDVKTYIFGKILD